MAAKKPPKTPRIPTEVHTTPIFLHIFRAEPLAGLKTKAAAIARHFDNDFDDTQDGIILQF